MKIGEQSLDEKHEAAGVEYAPCVVTDFSKLDIRDGTIFYKIYDQGGKFVPMTIADTYSNRLFVSWVQIHDRHIVHGAGGSKYLEQRP